MRPPDGQRDGHSDNIFLDFKITAGELCGFLSEASDIFGSISFFYFIDLESNRWCILFLCQLYA
jgi:hypothetical protein